MNTKKILKFYLVVTLSLSSIAVLSLSGAFEGFIPNYYSSVLDYKGGEAKPYLEAQTQNSTDDYHIYNKNPDEIMMDISGNSGATLVTAGAKDANFMNVIFKIGTMDVQLNGIAFKVSGVDGGAIENAYLTHGKAIIATAVITKDRIKFPNIDYEMPAGEVKNLQLKVDLGTNLKPGQIISLEIENPDDINMTVDGGSYSLNGQYPIQGKYLSIVRTR